MASPRVRIAPSPTGNLHVGTARTALYNYLFAKKMNGSFILRIEDTDLERSQKAYIKNIYDSLKALGLSWDEGPDVGGNFGPYIQTERLDRYKQVANDLMQKGLAYECYCSQEELDQEKEVAKANKQNFLYSGKCRNITPEQKKQYIEEGRTPTVRFIIPQKEIVLKDIIRGTVTFDPALIGDFIIQKSNGTPSYNFAVVVDDIDMKISHVIRGEDHISNTGRQLMIYEALGAELPQFAHLGMILAPDKSKMSKRHGATAVSDYIEQGYLPEAFVNFLALLGWSPQDEQEVKSLEDIITLFSLDRVSPSGTVFDIEKLNWMNGVYIRSMPIEEITNRIKPYLKDYDLSTYTEDQLQQMINAVRERLTLLSDAKDAVPYFFGKDISIPEDVQEQALSNEEATTVLKSFLDALDTFTVDNVEALQAEMKAFVKSMKPLKPKNVMWPIRAALTGQLHGIDLALILHLLGKERIKHRVNAIISSKV